MNAKAILRSEEYDLPANLTVQKALKYLNLNPESYLVTREGELLTEDDQLRENDVIKLIPVISGGSS